MIQAARPALSVAGIPRPRAEARWSAVGLSIVFALGLMTCWVRELWAVTSFHCAVLILAAGVLTFGRPRWHWLAAAPLIAVVIGGAQLVTGRTAYTRATIGAMITWTTYAAVVFLITQFSADELWRRKWLRWLFGFAVVLVLGGIVQSYTSNSRVLWLFPTGFNEPVYGPFVYHNKFAQFVELVLPIPLLFAMRRRDWWSLFLLGVAAAMVGATVASGSRSGAIIGAIEVAVFPLIAWRRGLLRRGDVLRLLPQLLLFAAAGAAVMGWDYLGKRFQHDLSDDARLPMIESTIAMVKDKPWIGWGLGTWDKVYPAYATFDDGLYGNQAHCDWLQWPAEGGVTLLAVMLVVAAAGARAAIRYPWSAGTVFVLLHALVDYPMQQVPQFTALVWAMLALGISARGEDRD